MKKIEVVNGWFYIDGKFIVNFDFKDRYNHNITNKLIGQDTYALLSKHDVLDRVKAIEAVLPLDAIYLTGDGKSIESVTIDRIELHNKEYRFQIISKDKQDSFWLVIDLNGFFDVVHLFDCQQEKLLKIINNLYKENYDLTIEKNYTIKLFGDFKDRGFGESNDK